jgi:hypothetical protein
VCLKKAFCKISRKVGRAVMIFQTRSRAGYSCEGREWQQFHLLLKLTKEFKKILSVFNIRKVE